MSAVDKHAEAHRLRAELGYGARRIGTALGISRYAAEQLLDEPLPAPVAEAADVLGEPVADEVAVVAVPAEVAVRPVAVPVGQVARVAEPVADEPAVRELRVDLSRRPQLLRVLVGLFKAGVAAPVAVEVAVKAFAAAYHRALMHGELRPGQPYEVQVHVRAAA